MKFILTLLGIIGLIAAVLGGLYVGVYLCFIGGIVQVIEGAKQTPVCSSDVAFGLLRFCGTAVAGWVTFAVGAFVSGVCFAGANGIRSRRSRFSIR